MHSGKRIYVKNNKRVVKFLIVQETCIEAGQDRNSGHVGSGMWWEIAGK